MENFLYVDTETTGLDPCRDELLSVSVLDNDNRVLFHSYIKPRHRRKWRDAQKIHGITPELVKHAPTYTMVKKYLADIFRNRKIVMYNAAFDTDFLAESLTDCDSIYCCMLEFAEYNGEWNDYYNDWKWIKLAEAVKKVSPQFNFCAHDSLEDCKATREIWQFLMNRKNTTMEPEEQKKSM